MYRTWFFWRKIDKMFETIEIIQNHSNYISIRLNFQQQKKKKLHHTFSLFSFHFILYHQHPFNSFIVDNSQSHILSYYEFVCASKQGEKKHENSLWKYMFFPAELHRIYAIFRLYHIQMLEYGRKYFKKSVA